MKYARSYLGPPILMAAFLLLLLNTGKTFPIVGILTATTAVNIYWLLAGIVVVAFNHNRMEAFVDTIVWFLVIGFFLFAGGVSLAQGLFAPGAGGWIKSMMIPILSISEGTWNLILLVIQMGSAIWLVSGDWNSRPRVF